MSSKITIDELEKYLWGSAVLLRTHVDAGAYKQYIFPLLFFKRLSDVYDEECEKVRAEFGEEALDWEENHQFQIPDGAHWNDVRNVSQDVGKAIIEAFHKIETANPEKLHGIFGEASWTNKNRLPDRLLKDMLEHFSTKTLSIANCPADELGQGYEYLIKQFADDSGHTAQEFYTTVAVTEIELCTNQSLCAMVTDETVLSDYLYHNLRNRYEEIRNMCAIADGRGGLNLKIVGSIKVIVPSIEEQQQFVAFAEQSDKSKFALQEAINDLDALTKKIIAENLIPAGKE